MNDFASRLLHANTVDETLWAVTRHAVSRLGYADCVVYMVDSSGEFLIQKAAVGPKDVGGFDVMNPIKLQIGQGICGHVAKTGVSELVHDTSSDGRYTVDDSFRLSEITVPILSKGKVIGVIDSEHPQKNFYSIQDLEILETVASMTSVKIDQALALESLANHKANLEKKVEESTRELRRSVEELQESNAQIEQKNKENETLLKEIHHRVKNNLQVVMSLLNLHADRLSDSVEQQVFRDCQNRINSMSIVHEQLYQKGDLSRINAKEYVEEICNELFYSYKLSDTMTVKLNLDECFFNIEKSVPFGLILNELIVNVLKHVFSNGSNGLVSISLKEHPNSIFLDVSDNGAGFDTGQERSTMGLDLIEALTEQVDGVFLITSGDSGTTCVVEIPK
ncbi:MAG: histidine kinase dimerization/phosphoacceptor domain -containing protein [Crocinitomicaceae bacterium]|nr:histidine kinase dimerization/phosphoacceptor domain -containing protein [Crocinitomicaceae bacterium]